MRCLNFLLDLFEGEQKLFLQCWEERRSKIYVYLIDFVLFVIMHYIYIIQYINVSTNKKLNIQYYSIFFNICSKLWTRQLFRTTSKYILYILNVIHYKNNLIMFFIIRICIDYDWKSVNLPYINYLNTDKFQHHCQESQIRTWDHRTSSLAQPHLQPYSTVWPGLKLSYIYSKTAFSPLGWEVPKILSYSALLKCQFLIKF